MTTELFQIQRLGWIAVDEGQRCADGRWRVFVMRDPWEMILAFADTCARAWAAAWSMAVRLACEDRTTI
jgi:hypothetical protein